jgi:hypothetical protein
MQVLRNGIMICNRAVVSVEGRIEASNLRKLRKICNDGADRREIVLLVQGRPYEPRCAGGPAGGRRYKSVTVKV